MTSLTDLLFPEHQRRKEIGRAFVFVFRLAKHCDPLFSCPLCRATETAVSSHATLEDVELSVIQKSLEAHSGNVSATARALGVSRNTIYRKIHP